MIGTYRYFASRLIALLCIGMLGGCALFQKKKENPELLPPVVKVEMTHFAGSPLSGPTTKVVDLAKAERLDARIDILALRNLPGKLPSTLGSAARLISASRSGTPVQPTNKLTVDSRVALDQVAQDAFTAVTDSSNVNSTVLFGSDDAVVSDVTSKLHLGLSEGRAVELLLYRDETTKLVMVALTIIEPVEDNQNSTTVIARETAVLDGIEAAQPRSLLLVVPQKLTPSPAMALAILLTLKPSDPANDSAALVDRIANDVKSSSDLASKWPLTPTVGSAESTGYMSSLTGLNDPLRRRAALVYLASQTSASICEDVALVADDALLEKLSLQIVQNAKPETTSQKELLGWILDLSTFQLLAQLQSDAKVKIAPELVAVLTRHAGEAGRHDSSMEQIVKNLTSKADLANRVIAENLIYLEDSSPAARVRAYDFLNSRGKAPAGFDPLGTPRERRAALEKASIK